MERVAHCHLIARVLAADGIMEDQERAFLERAMAKMGLSDDERDQVMHFEGTEGAEEALAAMPEADRRKVVDDLVAAALIDGKLSPHETEIVKNVTKALGL